MSRIYPYLCAALGGAALAALAYAWQLRQELSSALAVRDGMATRVQGLTQSIAERDEQIARLAKPPEPVASPPATVGPAPADPRQAPAARDARRTAYLQSPEFQKMRQLEERERLDQRFAGLFRRLNLAPADLDRFKDLLVERDLVASDVYQAARSLGLNFRDNRDQIQKQVADAQAAVDATIASTLGDAVLQQYQQYQQAAPQRFVAGQLERRLSYTPTPLTASQSDTLVTLLAAAAPGNGPANAAGEQEALEFGPGFRGLAALSDATIDQSRAFLSAPQIDTLRQMRDAAQQRAVLRQQLQARMRAGGGGP